MEDLIGLFNNNFHLLKKYKIIVIANVRNKNGIYKNLNLRMANRNEFFSDEEYSEIYNGIKSIGLFTKIYFNELDFIEETLPNTCDVNNMLVINFARNGTIEGKKSLIPAFCDLLKIKYSTCNAFVQSLCRNKYICSEVLRSENVPVPLTELWDRDKRLSRNKFKNEDLCIIKPVAESSSIGVSRVMKYQEITNHILNEKRYVVQEYLCGSEFEVPFFELNNKFYIMEPAKINYSAEFLDEQNSILNNYYYEKCESSFKFKCFLKNCTEKVANILNMKKYGRVDFKLDKNGNPYVIDIATLPYITQKSSFNYNLQQNGYEYNTIFKILLAITLFSNDQS